MIFKLNQPPIDEVEFIDKTYSVDMAFDNILDVLDVLDDAEIGTMERIYNSLYLLIGEQIDELNLIGQKELLNLIFEELIQSDVKEKIVELDRAGNPLPSEDTSSKALFDLVFDATYIWTAFMETYHMDLHDKFGELHWTKFMLLLRDLPETTVFSKIQDIRGKKLSDIKDMKERKEIRRLQKTFRLPNQELEEDELASRFED